MTLIADRPGPAAARSYRFPRVLRDDGVVAAHLPGQRLAVAVLLLDAGAVREPVGGEGVATVLAKALQEGTVERDAAAFALALEALGTTLSTSVDWDSLRVAVQAPADRLAAAVTLLAEAVGTPRLDPATVARVRDDEASARRIAWAGAGPRADAALRADVFGVQQRAGGPLRGDPATVAALPADRVAAFHGQWCAQPGTLVVAGDLDRLDLDVLRTAAGVRAATATPLGAPLPVEARSGRRIVLVDRPGSVQSALRLGHAAPQWSHPDRVAMKLAATVLGGAFTSRLNHLIREVRGYTYGIRGEFHHTRRFGSFVVSAAVQTAVTAPALVDTVAEIARTQADGVTAAELAVASAWRAGKLSVDLQTPGAIAAALAQLVVHDLPDDHYARLHAELLDADVATASAAAARHLHPDGLTLVVEGAADSIRDDLVASGLGEVIDAPAAPGRAG